MKWREDFKSISLANTQKRTDGYNFSSYSDSNGGKNWNLFISRLSTKWAESWIDGEFYDADTLGAEFVEQGEKNHWIFHRRELHLKVKKHELKKFCELCRHEISLRPKYEIPRVKSDNQLAVRLFTKEVTFKLI